MRFRRFLFILLLLPLLPLAACTRMVPLPDPVRTVASDRWGSTQMVGEVSVTVRSVGWNSFPLRGLEPYVTALFVEVRNDGATPVRFDPMAALVVDNERTLYRPLPPERLESILTGGRRPILEVTDPVPYPYDTDIAATLGALTAGDVAPGTRVRGAIYFQRVADWAKQLTLRLTVGDQVREFRFRVN